MSDEMDWQGIVEGWKLSFQTALKRARDAEEQLAVERAARQAAEAAVARAMTVGGEALAQLAALRDWIHQQARILRPDGALCWCSPADVAAHYPDHGYSCSQARALLTPQEAPANADLKTE